MSGLVGNIAVYSPSCSTEMKGNGVTKDIGLSHCKPPKHTEALLCQGHPGPSGLIPSRTFLLASLKRAFPISPVSLASSLTSQL